MFSDDRVGEERLSDADRTMYDHRADVVGDCCEDILRLDHVVECRVGKAAVAMDRLPLPVQPLEFLFDLGDAAVADDPVLASRSVRSEATDRLVLGHEVLLGASGWP